MSKIKHALMLLGSPRGKTSNSSMLLRYISERLQREGVETEDLWIHHSIKSDEGISKLLNRMNETDLIILSAPLYVDCLPAAVIKALQIIQKRTGNEKRTKEQGFFVIVNSGFPEAHHSDVAISIYERFAGEMGYKWLGGFTLGMGEMINRKPLNESGGVLKNLKKSLDLAITSLIKGEKIPYESLNILRKPPIPIWMYILFGNWGWKKLAKKYGTRNDLRARPYERLS